MDELIYRYALLEQIEKDSEGTLGSYGENWQFINTIRKMPTIERRPKGEWVYHENDMFCVRWNKWECNQCHERVEYKYNFCPNCGADMRGGDTE